jgi:hypothetical protein
VHNAVENNQISNRAVVLGNGPSRLTFNLQHLKNHSGHLGADTVQTYGCNALYRELPPHHLIAVDTKMIREIVATGYHLKNPVWTNPNSYSKSVPKLCIFNPSLGWSSGPSALNLATIHGFNVIYILGFDYEGLGTNKEYVNNIYAGTQNYKKIDERSTYFGNWTRQTATIIQKNHEVKYVRVIKDKNSFIPDNLRNFSNLQHITVENFISKFRC